MTFLELVVNLRKECSVAGAGPVTIHDPRAEYQRLIKWIVESNAEIQGKYTNWRFLWDQGSFETAADQQVYLPGKHLPQMINTFRMAFFMIDGEHLSVVDYFDLVSFFYTEKVYGKPTILIIMPDNSITVWPIPDKGYSISFEYYKQPQQLEEGDDIPLIPSPWHKLIVYRAMMMYGDYENAPEIKQAGMEGLASIMPQLEANQLPGQRDSAMVNEYDIVIKPE